MTAFQCCDRCITQLTCIAQNVCASRLSSDPVASPPHYTDGGIEVIDAIEAWRLGFHLGNVVKYVARAGKKDPSKTVEDLKKGRWYLDREIARLEGGAK